MTSSPRPCVQEAELYLQSIHTKTNNLSRNDQIRDLVALAHSVIASKTNSPETVWSKSDAIVNSLLQTSEHLQQEQDVMLSRRAHGEKSGIDQNSLHDTRGGVFPREGHPSSPADKQCPDTADPELCNSSNATQRQKGASEVGGTHDEIGDIEWEATPPTDVNFEHIVGCHDAIDAIRESVVIPMQFPSLFKRLNVKRSNGIMLYGPPGTGKSMIARAAASEVKACFFNASCAELTSRWVGGSEKKLKSLFATAVRKSPSIIFFDEVDSIACKREGDGSIADQRLTNQLLIELDKIFLAQSDVFVIAATNLPWQIDLAVMRRFPHTVYIDLPNAASRGRMFRSLFGPDRYSDANIATLAQLSEHMSGSDIANVVNSVLFEPIRILCKSTHFIVSTWPQPIIGEGDDTQNTEDHAITTEAHTPSHVSAVVMRITSASIREMQIYIIDTPCEDANNGSSVLVARTLEQIVTEYGENCIVMPVVDFQDIREKVESFRHTVSREYLQQYVQFHDKNS